MARPQRQTTIGDHFTPSGKYRVQGGAKPRHSRVPHKPPPRYHNSVSEGSDGLANIRLTQTQDASGPEVSQDETPRRRKRASPKRKEPGIREREKLKRPEWEPLGGKENSERIEARLLEDDSEERKDDFIAEDSTEEGIIAASESHALPRRRARRAVDFEISVSSAASKTGATKGRISGDGQSQPSIPRSNSANKLPLRSSFQAARPLALPAAKRQPTPGLIPYVEIPMRPSLETSTETLLPRLAPGKTKATRLSRPMPVQDVSEDEITALPSPPKPRPTSRQPAWNPSPPEPTNHMTRRAPSPLSAVKEDAFFVIEVAADSDDDAVLGRQKRTLRPINSFRTKWRQPLQKAHAALSLSPSSRKNAKGSFTPRQRLRSDPSKADPTAAKSVVENKPPRFKASQEDPVHNEESDADDIELDEPERFKTETRLRGRTENAFQRKLRQLKEKRLGLEGSTTDEEADEGAVDAVDDDESGEEESEEDFIEEDGGKAGDVALPHQFSLDSAQSPEFKFKVVFHYLVMLNIRGHEILPLRGDAQEYFKPQLDHLRRMITGHRDSSVRSQIWRADFVKALQTYPNFVEQYLDVSHYGCDACHISGRISRYEITLEGSPYDHETHRVQDTDSKEEREMEKRQRAKARKDRRRKFPDAQSVSSDESEEPSDELARKFFMGKFCKARAQIYHMMSHWEDDLYCRIREYYKDLLRALEKPVPSNSESSSSETDSDESEGERSRRREKRDIKRAATAKRVAQLRTKRLPHHRDVDRITEWMDVQMGYQAKEFRWFNEIITRSERLEYDKGTDE